MTEEFSQCILEFFATHGDELPDEDWQLFHRWYNRVEMAQCATAFEEGLTMQFITGKEFAAALGVSNRTIQDWRISRDGKPPRLPADHIDERGRAVYTEAQLEIARALLNRNQKTATTEPPEDKPVEPAETAADIPPVPEPATIAADAQIVTLDQRADKIRRLQADVQRSMIEIGRELIAAKAEIGHGNWTAWLEAEFEWTDRTARYFMACAERFGNRNTYSDLKPSTLKAMLALPVGSEDEFIATQDAAGKPVKAMSARDVQTAVKEFKARLGELFNQMPKATNGGANQYSARFPAEGNKLANEPTVEKPKPKLEVAAEMGFNKNQVAQFQKLADNPAAVKKTIDEDEPQRADDDDDLRKARAQAENALEAISAAIMQTADCDALKAVTEALTAIAAELDAKKLARNRREQKGNKHNEYRQ